MLDVFTRKTTRIQGRALPGAGERAAIQDDHERRLASFARLGAAAEKCDLRADSDQDLVLLAEDEVSLLEGAGGAWAATLVWSAMVTRSTGTTSRTMPGRAGGPPGRA